MLTIRGPRVPLLAVAVLATVLGGCTYDEDQLRGVQKPPTDTGPIFVPDASVSAEDAPLDAEGLDGSGLDTGAIDVASDVAVDAPALDVALDSPTAVGVDGKAVDGQPLDGIVTDAGDVPITSGGVDSSVDTRALDVPGSEAGKADGTPKLDGMTPG